jgi:hypothetical protein
LCLAAGTYSASVFITKNLTLRGAGQDPQGEFRTHLIGAERGKPVVRIESTSAIQVILEGLSISDAQATSRFPFCAQLDPAICPHGVQIGGRARLTLQNAQIVGNEFSGLVARGAAQVQIRDSLVEGNLDIEAGAVVARDEVQLTIARTQISENGVRGLFLAERAKATVSQSQISGHYTDGIFVRDAAQLELRDSIIEENEACGLRSTSTGALRGGQNKFANHGLGPLCGRVPPSLRMPRVAQTNRARLSVPQDYARLEEAVDAVAPGGTILIAAGEYEGGFSIYKSLTLQGAGASQTRITDGLAICCEAQKARVEKVLLQEAITRGMLIAGASLQVALVDMTLSGAAEGGLEVSGSVGVEIRNSVIQEIKGLTYEGLKISDGAQVTVGATRISRNEGAGVLIVNGRAVFTDVQISDNKGDGLRLRGGQATLAGTRLANNGDDGLEVEGQITVNNSQILGNRRTGLRLQGGQATLGAGTRIAENGAGGLSAEGGRLTLTNAEVSMNQASGLALEGSAVAQIESSRVLNNFQHGLRLEGGARLEMRAGLVQGNGADGVQVSDRSGASITGSKVLHNAGWGLVAVLKRCGFSEDRFRGTVTQSNNEISGNRRGDVCLP